MDSSPLVNCVLSTHKPESWDSMTAGTEVHLAELYTYSQEFSSIRDKIQQTLLVDVSRVMRVQNPYLYGTYDIAITSNLIRHATDVTPCHVNGRGKDPSVHAILHVDFHRT
jgi:hypothetical protein